MVRTVNVLIVLQRYNNNFMLDMLTQMFFGCVRQSSGADDHPSPNQFLYIYRMMSIKSLLQSPKRASIQTERSRVLVSIQSAPPKSTSSSSVLKAIETVIQPLIERHRLTNLSDQDLSDLVMAYCNSNSDEFDDLLLGNEIDVGNIGDLLLQCDEELTERKECDKENLEMTCEEDGSPDVCIGYYLHGYVAHKLIKFTNCKLCHESVIDSRNDVQQMSEARLVLLKSYGGLKFPSKTLQSLLKVLEKCVMKHSVISTNMYEAIMNEVLASCELASLAVGCDSHCCSLTARCIRFYVTTRLHFLNRSANKRRSSRQEKKA